LLARAGSVFVCPASVEGETADVRYVRTPFDAEPDLKATSVNYDLAKLLARSHEPVLYSRIEIRSPPG